MITCSFCLLIRITVGWLLASKVQNFLQLYPIKFLQQALTGLWHEPLHCSMDCSRPRLSLPYYNYLVKTIVRLPRGAISNMKRFSAHYTDSLIHVPL